MSSPSSATDKFFSNIPEASSLDENHRQSLLYNSLSEREKERYNTFIECGLECKKKSRQSQTTQKMKTEMPRVKKIVQNFLGEEVQIPTLVQFILHGVAKVYAGELVEEAKKVMLEERWENVKKDIEKDMENNVGNDMKNDIGKHIRGDGDKSNGERVGVMDLDIVGESSVGVDVRTLNVNGVNGNNSENKGGNCSGFFRRNEGLSMDFGIRPRHLREAKRRMMRGGYGCEECMTSGSGRYFLRKKRKFID